MGFLFPCRKGVAHGRGYPLEKRGNPSASASVGSASCERFGAAGDAVCVRAVAATNGANWLESCARWFSSSTEESRRWRRVRCRTVCLHLLSEVPARPGCGGEQENILKCCVLVLERVWLRRQVRSELGESGFCCTWQSPVRIQAFCETDWTHENTRGRNCFLQNSYGHLGCQRCAVSCWSRSERWRLPPSQPC